VYTATYDVPYLAHACMEPMNCTAWVTPERAQVWVGTQDPEAVVELARSITGLAADRIEVHPQWMGGAFGRRVATDYVAEALHVARRVGRPVQLLWTREQDLRRGYYRPMAACRLSATMSGGAPTALRARCATDSIFAQHRPQDLQGGVDPTSTMGLVAMPYAWDQVRIESRDLQSPVPTWFWRSVGASQNVFALECFMDELAAHAGVDGLALRRKMLHGQPRHLAVLAALDKHAQLQEPLPPGRGRGLAIHEYARTVVGQAIDVAVTPAGQLSVQRVVAVVDCGNVVNPRIVEQQIEGGIVFALEAALHGGITIEGGRVREGNFDTFRTLTMRDCPAIETHLLPSGGDVWGGAGEPGVPPVAAALCNAIHAATKKRIRSLPVAQHDLSWPDTRTAS
jgi:isoquinoline 1-oxidoreductase beta subunit